MTADVLPTATRTVTARFVALSDDIVRAVAAVTVVCPRRLGLRAGCLLVASQDASSQGTCAIYSRSDSTVARSTFALSSLEVQGRFVFVAEHLQFLRESPRTDEVTVEARTEGIGAGMEYWVDVRTSSGAHYDHTTFNPSLFARCDADLDRATPVCVASSATLATGIRILRPFVAPPNDKYVSDAESGVRAEGDGRLVAMSGTQMAVFRSPALSGTRFSIRREQLTSFQRFLARAKGTVAIRAASRNNFAVSDQGDVYGWNGGPLARRPSPSDYPEQRDDVVARVARERLLSALEQVKSVAGRRASITLAIDPAQVRVTAGRQGESIEVSVPAVSYHRDAARTDFLVGVKDLARFVKTLRGEEVDLRFVIVAQPPFALLRVHETVVTPRPPRADESVSATVTKYAIVTPRRHAESEPSGGVGHAE
jgi:hypothetical protein